MSKAGDFLNEFRTNSYKDDPREITARFDSVCPETKKPIKKGEKCIYYPKSKKCFHPDSKTADDYRSWKMDQSMGNDY